MKVILLEDVTGAGSAGDVVEVKNGYARNKLLPSGIAIEASTTNMKTLEHRRTKIAAKKAADKEMAQEFADVIEGKQVDFTAKAGDSGKLFGSVTAHDIAEAVKEKLGYEIDRRKLLLDTPIKEIGLHEVKYRVYPEVEATINVSVAAEGAPTLPPAEKLRDTYSDAVLDGDEDAGFVFGSAGDGAGKAAGDSADAGESAGDSADDGADEGAAGIGEEVDEAAGPEAGDAAEDEAEVEAEAEAEPEVEAETEAEAVEPAPEAVPEDESEAEAEAETETVEPAPESEAEIETEADEEPDEPDEETKEEGEENETAPDTDGEA